MEKGLWCYEANVAEPSHLNTASLAGEQSYYTITQPFTNTTHCLKAACNWTILKIYHIYDHSRNVLKDFGLLPVHRRA